MIGIVAAVLAVLIVLAITFKDPRRNRRGDIRATAHIWNRYQMTWTESPPTTTAISQINEVLAEPNVKARLTELGGDPLISSPEAFGAMMAAETLAQMNGEGFRTEPGAMGEQIVLAGIDIDRLAPGMRLRIGGQVVVEVAQPRTGCDRFSHIQSKPISATTGRLGVMAKVIAAGEVRIGDSVEVLPSTVEAESK